MIEVHELVKAFPTTEGGEKRAVDGVSFTVGPGEIFGLLGPNGAGKTTALRMLSGLLTPTSGWARLNGHNVLSEQQDAKRSLGYITANTGLYQRLSPRELLRYFGELIGLDRPAVDRRINVLIDWLDMASFADLRCGSLSTGQKQRTNIARALMGDPPILVMDEPTLGLDVLTNRIVLDFIRAEGARGKAIIMSTHYLDEAETLCHRFGLLHEGKLLALDDLAGLRTRSSHQRLSDIFLDLCGADRHVLEYGGDSAAPGGSENPDVRRESQQRAKGLTHQENPLLLSDPSACSPSEGKPLPHGRGSDQMGADTPQKGALPPPRSPSEGCP